MAAWKKIIVSGSDAELNSLNVTGPVTASGFKGDGSQLTGIATTLAISGSTSGSDTVNLKTDALTFSGGNNVTATVTDNTVTIGVSGLISQSSQVDHDATTNFVANEHIDHSAVSINAGFGLAGGGDITATRTLSLDTGSSTFLDAVKNKLNTESVISSSAQVQYGSISGVPGGIISSSEQVSYTQISNVPSGIVSASSQVDVRDTTGIATIATTGSNTFTGVQTITNSTNSTNYTDGALIVQGGIGVAKDVNISGSLNVTGLLTVASMSTQYVTSSQYNIGVSRVIVNDDDLVRFAGLSVVDSGSTYGTGSLLWDSLENRWIYQADDQNYNSAIIIAGPKNLGTLGNEVGLISGRIPVATGDDHIDTNLASSSIYVDFSNRRTFIEAGLYVTGGISASGDVTAVNFRGSGQFLTDIAADSVQYANVLNKPALVSSSGQIDHDLTTNFVANEHIDHSTVSINTGIGLLGGGDITTTRTVSLDTGSTTFLDGIKTKLNTEGVVSSSGQIVTVLNTQNVHSASYLGTATTSNLPEGTNLYYLDTRVKDKLNLDGVVSSSAQIVAGVAGQTIEPTTVNTTTITTTGNVTVGGDLTVNGTTTTINTTNVLIEDRYLLLNSGSVLGAPAQGGIVVQDGVTASGSAMLYSTDNSKNRWGVAENVAANAASAVQTAYVATVTDMSVTAQASAVATYEKPGNIKVDTNGDIYIWS